MNEVEETDFREAFLVGNANNDFIAGQVEDVLRTLIRSVASQNPGANIAKVVERLVFILDLAKRCPDLDAFQIVQDAVYALADVDQDDTLDSAMNGAARTGMMYFIEASATDNAARGRASKRRADFVQSMRLLEEVREHRRAEFRSGK